MVKRCQQKLTNRKIVGRIDNDTFIRGCSEFNHHELVEQYINGKWESVLKYPLGCCLNQDHPNFKKPCVYFKLNKQ